MSYLLVLSSRPQWYYYGMKLELAQDPLSNWHSNYHSLTKNQLTAKITWSWWIIYMLTGLLPSNNLLQTLVSRDQLRQQYRAYPYNSLPAYRLWNHMGYFSILMVGRMVPWSSLVSPVDQWVNQRLSLWQPLLKPLMNWSSYWWSFLCPEYRSVKWTRVWCMHIPSSL